MRLNKWKKNIYLMKSVYMNGWTSSAIMRGAQNDEYQIGTDISKLLHSARAWHNRGNKSLEWINATRHWQIKNRLNYGRY